MLLPIMKVKRKEMEKVNFSIFLFEPRRRGSVYLGVVVLGVFKCICFGNLHARSCRV